VGRIQLVLFEVMIKSSPPQNNRLRIPIVAFPASGASFDVLRAAVGVTTGRRTNRTDR
jgi:hypothetical protein